MMNGRKKRGMDRGRDLESEGRTVVWIMDGCLKRHEEEEVMHVYYSLNNESQNILNMINDRWLPWWGVGAGGGGGWGAKNFTYK